MPRSFSSNSKTSSNPLRLLSSALVLAAALSACGRSGGSGGDTPPPGGEAACATGIDAGLTADAVAPTDAAELARKKEPRVDGSSRGRVLDALWLNRARAGRARPRAGATAGRAAIDIGDIAVIQDEGELIESPNTYDLRSLGLRFARNGAGGYDVTRIAGGFRTAVGTRVTLTDDDSRQVNVPFGFPFYGRSQTAAFVNSDGNITFEEEDRASTDRNVARLLTGPPRVAAVPRRSRSVHRRPRPRERGDGSVHRHLVRRPRLRLDPDDQRAADAAADRRHRDEVRRRHAGRGHRRAVAGPDR